METKEKLKLCPYCDGRVSIEAMQCPYCGEIFGEGLAFQKGKGKSRLEEIRPLDESLASSYEPPYVAKSYTKPGIPNISPRKQKKSTPTPFQEREEPEESKKSVWSLLLLSVGAHLFTLGWLIFFFSERGQLILEWKSRYWPIYVLLSLAPLYYGARSLKSQ
jgi:hypothetical protein